MNYYINIQIKPDAEMRENVLLNKTFTKLHKALYESKETSIGVSFPDHKVKLGNTIRLHSDKASLEVLQRSNWLGGLSGYCEVSDVLPVPERIKGYRTVSRIQQTMTLKKLDKRIRYQKECCVLKTDEEIKSYESQYKAKMYATGLDHPYLELTSASNGHMHRRYIKFGELLDNPVKGDFNQFGLSKTATIPWF